MGRSKRMEGRVNGIAAKTPSPCQCRKYRPAADSRGIELRVWGGGFLERVQPEVIVSSSVACWTGSAMIAYCYHCQWRLLS